MPEQDEVAEFSRLFLAFLERMHQTPQGIARENLRARAVLLAAEAGTVPGGTQLRAAAAELLSARDTLTRRLLGAADPR